VLRGQVVDGGVLLEVGGDSPSRLKARSVVNAAGLSACQVARSIDGLGPGHVPTPHYALGAYFTLGGRAPFSRLVYPVPGESSHLGVHLTLDLGGQARFGPSFRWVETDGSGFDYRVDPADGAGFDAEVRRYWPGLPAGALQPAYSGVRPKLQQQGAAALDFMLQGPAEHGVAGLVNLYAIESPGLTACLALADEVLTHLGPA
jgi:L-2-hydroxyglutarate oxidase LhgO